MTIESAVAHVLINSVGLAALADGRVYPMVAPQDVAGPFVVYERVPVEIIYTHAGIDPLQTARFRFTMGSARYSDVVDLSGAIVVAFSAASLGDGTVTVCGCFLDQPDDAFLIESAIYSRSIDIDIQFLD